MKNVISMRKRLNMFGRGEMKFLESSNAKVLSFVRTFEKQRIIVVANLSQFSQSTIINLSSYKGCDITEVFSQNRFMSVGEGDYPITIGPYGYFWFQADVAEKKEKEASGELHLLKTEVSWEKLFDNYNELRVLERKVLLPFMKKCRWFGGKAKAVSKVSIHKTIPVKVEGDTHFLAVIEVHYVQRLPELYFLPLAFLPTDSIMERVEYTVQSVVCRAEIQGKAGFIMDSSYDKLFRDFLFVSMGKETKVRDDEGGVLQFNSGVFAKIDVNKAIDSKILRADQSNTAIIYNDQYFFKFYRKLENEINPELEIVQFLSEHTTFRNSPRYAGSVEYHDQEGNVIVGRFYERVMLKAKTLKLPKLINKAAIKFEEAPEVIQEFIGRGFYERMVRLGVRTAEMHLALGSNTSNPAFTPESFTANYQRSLYSSLRKLVKDRFNLLEVSLPKLNPDVQEFAKKVLALEPDIMECFSEVYQLKVKANKIRIHGDYHLGQVLFTGKDFVIIDFEGEPGLSFSERRLKKSALKDVAGMMRSIHYAAFGKILLNENYRERDLEFLESWAEQWQHYVSRFYLGAYMERMNMGTSLSTEDDVLIRTFLLEKAIYELGYELNGRPDWTIIPLRGIHYIMKRYQEEKEERKKK
jgi:maltose alpha-D-glucosyltransferase/alpha-amylase